MKPSGFFFVYSFLTMVLLAEVTIGRGNLQDILGGTIVYAVVIPLAVVLMLLAGVMAHKYRNSKRVEGYKLKAPLGNLLRTTGFLGTGALLSVIPSLVGHYLKPLTGWVLLPVVLLVLYWLDKKMGKNQSSLQR